MALTSAIYQEIIDVLWDENRTLTNQDFYRRIPQVTENHLKTCLSRASKLGLIKRLSRGLYALPKVAEQLARISDLPAQKLSLHNLRAKKRFHSSIKTKINGHGWNYCDENKSYILSATIREYVSVTIIVTNKGLVTVHSQNTDTRGAFATYEEFQAYENAVAILLHNALEVNYKKEFLYYGFDLAIDDRFVQYGGPAVQQKVLDDYLIKFYQKTEQTFRKELVKLDSKRAVTSEELGETMQHVSTFDLSEAMMGNKLGAEALDFIQKNKFMYQALTANEENHYRDIRRIGTENREYLLKMQEKSNQLEQDIININMALATGNVTDKQIYASMLRREGELERGITHLTTELTKVIATRINEVEQKLSAKIDALPINSLDRTYSDILQALQETGSTTSKALAKYMHLKIGTVSARLSELKKKKEVRIVKQVGRTNVWGVKRG